MSNVVSLFECGCCPGCGRPMDTAKIKASNPRDDVLVLDCLTCGISLFRPQSMNGRKDAAKLRGDRTSPPADHRRVIHWGGPGRPWMAAARLVRYDRPINRPPDAHNLVGPMMLLMLTALALSASPAARRGRFQSVRDCPRRGTYWAASPRRTKCKSCRRRPERCEPIY